MNALSIRQPWAWLIVNGYKDIENRAWDSTYRGLFYVHAAKSLYGTREQRNDIRNCVWERFRIGLPCDQSFERGGIVGQASLVDVVTESKSAWFKGPRGFVLEHQAPLRFRPCKGRLGFFEVQPSKRNDLRARTMLGKQSARLAPPTCSRSEIDCSGAQRVTDARVGLRCHDTGVERTRFKCRCRAFCADNKKRSNRSGFLAPSLC
jgi:hypothetical protein